jgi:hypothetical protein
MRSRLAPLLLCSVPLVSVACVNYDITQFKMAFDAAPPSSVLLGGVEIEGIGMVGTPGRHYAFWIVDRDGNNTLVKRLIVAEAPQAIKDLHDVIGDDAAMVRSLDDSAFLGYVGTQCFNGPCGGIEMSTEEFLGDAVRAVVSREDDSVLEQEPSDDVLVRGPLQPWARGTLRGTLLGPDGQQVPRIELTVIPEYDGAVW